MAGAVVMGLSGGLFFVGFGFFFEPMRNAFGWSRTVLSLAFAISRVEGGALGPLEGYLIQRFGPRNVISVCMVLFGVGFILLSLVNSIFTFYTVFIIIALGAGSGGFTGSMAAINNWFRKKRARASGFGMLGMGIGGVLCPPLLAFLITSYGWRSTAIIAGIIVMCIGIPISRIIRYEPEPYGYKPDGDNANAEPKSAPLLDSLNETSIAQNISSHYGTDFTVKQAVKTQAFWLMATGHSLALLIISVVSLHQVPYLESILGFSRNSAATIVMAMTATSMLGQVIGGFIGDKYNKAYIASVTILGHSAGLYLLAIADDYTLVLVSALIQGFSWGIRTPVLISIRGEYFGRKSYAMIMGISQTIMMIGMIIGPVFAGYFADYFSYSLGFKIIALAALPGFFMFIALKKPVCNKDPV